MGLSDILPSKINYCLAEINVDMLNEIRLRVNKPIIVNLNTRSYYLTSNGLTNNWNEAVICENSDINYIINKVSDNSFYTINDEIINGYISYTGGIRIGVAGEVVTQNNIVKTIKNISSLNIRIPHQIKNCSLNTYSSLVINNQIKSTLVVSSPGAGKTTYIRDLVQQISKRLIDKSILILDERGEISGGGKFNLGNNVDVLLNCSKEYGMTNGIRSLKPDVIVTDEISLNNDLEVIENALTSGCKIIATIHAKDINELKMKKSFKEIINNQLFERYVVLSNNCGVGSLEGVYNQNLDCICV